MKYLAHLKWFESSDGMVATLASSQQLLFGLGLVIVGVIIFMLLEYYLLASERKIYARIKSWSVYAPTAVRITMGTSLIIFALQGKFLAPNVSSASTVDASGLLLLFEFLVGAMLVLGLRVRVASYGLLGLYFLQVFCPPAISLLEHLELVGVAIFLYVLGAGRYSLDELFGNLPKIGQDSAKKAIMSLQFCVGTSLLTLGLTEKLFNMTLAQDFINDYHWNFLSRWHVSDAWFIVLIGASEVLLGVLLVLNVASRLSIAIVGLTMLVTMYLLGVDEVTGHLFAFGVVFAIWTMVEPQASEWLPKRFFKPKA